MADVGASGSRTGVALGEDETPAIVCGSCHRGTPLASLRPDVDVPHCRHCGVRLPGFRGVRPPAIDRRAIVTAMVDALEFRNVDAAGTLVHDDVVWQEAPAGPTIAGRDALLAHWRAAPASRTLGTLTEVEDVVFGLVLERDRPDGDQLLRWFVGFHDDLIASCWVWNLRRDTHAPSGE